MYRYQLPACYVYDAIERGIISNDAVVARDATRWTVRLATMSEFERVNNDAARRAESPHVFIRYIADEVLDRLARDA